MSEQPPFDDRFRRDEPARSEPAEPQPKKKTGRGAKIWAVFSTILLVLSALLNALLLFAVIGLIAFAGGVGTEGVVNEQVLVPGGADKIAVVHVDGIIDDAAARRARRHIKKAAEDGDVKAVILHVNSPGGTITASDVIHQQLSKRLLGAAGRKPVVALMDEVAASGGYYVSAPCDEIVAHPTTITGSIGVITQMFFIKNLMEDKLGVQPVTLTRGNRKDWPNIFSQAGMTPEQRQYWEAKILDPAYEQFVDVVAAGRANLSRSEALRLATGEIFMGEAARQVGLVDRIGYFDDAVDVAAGLAGVSNPTVVEYRPMMTLQTLLGAQADRRASLPVTREGLAELAAPRVQYLWTGQAGGG